MAAKADQDAADRDHAVEEFGVIQALDLFHKHTTAINGLWGVYVAAAFAAVGFSQLSPDYSDWVNCLIAAAVIVGFGAFTIGHWSLLRREIVARTEIASFVIDRVQMWTHARSRALALAEVDKASVLTMSFLPHVVIDGCVVSTLIVRAIAI